MKSSIRERERYVTEFTELKNWRTNSPDLNPVDYLVWGVATDGYLHRISDIDQLKRVIVGLSFYATH